MNLLVSKTLLVCLLVLAVRSALGGHHEGVNTTCVEKLMKKFMVEEEMGETTYQINTICKNASKLVPTKSVHLYIDECWITVPKMFEAHLTLVSVIHRSSGQFCNFANIIRY